MMASFGDTDNRFNPYTPRHRSSFQKPWYRQSWVWIAGLIVIVLALFWLSQKGLMPQFIGSNNQTIQNVTRQPTEIEQVAQYIIAQRASGIQDAEITQKLTLAGYSTTNIQGGFELADPIVQYIIGEMAQGTPKTAIIETLLQQGYTPEVIQQKFAVVDKQQAGIWDNIKKYWWIGLIILLLVVVGREYIDKAQEKKLPRVYSLEECREYAEEKLKEKNMDFNPCKIYKNRAEVRQYRYVYEEPIYPEFNTQHPYGNKPAQRQYYFIAVGYDRELLDFRITKADSEIHDFLHGPPKSWESRSAAEYSRIRERSEMPIEDVMKQERERLARSGMIPPVPQPQGAQTETLRNRLFGRRRYLPGPVEGYE